MEKTIKEIKENGKNLENNILKLISDFEADNPEVEVRVNVSRNYSSELSKASHNADVNLSIK